MSNRSAKFVPALFAGVLAGVTLAAVTDLRAQAAADSCLTSPKATTPAGSHWYYRIDRASKRQCWYLREESGATTLAAPPDSPRAATSAPAPPQPRADARRSIADARAEWTSRQARAEQNSPANAEPGTGGAIAAPRVQNDNRVAAPNPLAPTPLAATRWLDTYGVNSSSNRASFPTAAAGQPDEAEQVQPQAQQQIQLSQQIQQPPAPAFRLAAADSSMTKPTASMQMLFLVMAAALALAGITVSLVVRIGRARARAIIRRNRRTMWDAAKAGRSVHPGEEARARRAAAAHQPRAHASGDRERQVNDMLGRLARSTRT